MNNEFNSQGSLPNDRDMEYRGITMPISNPNPTFQQPLEYTNSNNSENQ